MVKGSVVLGANQGSEIPTGNVLLCIQEALCLCSLKTLQPLCNGHLQLEKNILKNC